MIKFTDDEAMEALRKAVRDYGADHVAGGLNSYGTTKCRFWDKDNDCPSCLIGVALTILGISKKELIAADSYDTSFETSPFGMPGAGLFSRRIVETFAEAQWWQDAGHIWGVALEKAEKKYLLYA